jgi:hypothetical protein
MVMNHNDSTSIQLWCASGEASLVRKCKGDAILIIGFQRSEIQEGKACRDRRRQLVLTDELIFECKIDFLGHIAETIERPLKLGWHA